jgi:2-methylcitrate dehydratase PrpD
LPTVSNLSNKVSVNDNPEITKLLPDKRAARVEIRLSSGEVFEHTVYTAQGEFTHRFSEQDLWKKYENMLTDYSDEIIDTLKENLLNIRNYSTFKEWLHANELIGGAE